MIEHSQWGQLVILVLWMVPAGDWLHLVILAYQAEREQLSNWGRRKVNSQTFHHAAAAAALLLKFPSLEKELASKMCNLW